MDEILDAWDELNSACRKVSCALPAQLTSAVADMEYRQCNMERVLKAANRKVER